MKYLKNVVMLLILAASIQTYGQERPKCYTDELYEKAVKADPSFKEKRNKLDHDIMQYKKTKGIQKSGPDTTFPIVIPVIVYVVHNSGIGNITDTQVTSQITALNDSFTGSGISFCLATMLNNNPLPPPLGATQTTPGIMHINSGVNAIHDVATEQEALEATSGGSHDPERFLKIWVVNDIVENGQSTGIAGYTSLPGEEGDIRGIVMKNNVFGDSATCGGCSLMTGYDEGESLVHEVGHYLGLYHTFHQGCDELSQGGDCGLMGDRICDTPPAVETYGCNPGLNTCGADTINDDVQNFMSYSNNVCMAHFSPDQIERMLYSINLYRSVLVSIDNSIFTGVCGYQNIISANFEASNYAPCINGIVNFDPIIAGVNYHWDFGDPTSPNNISTLEAPNHTYISAVGSPYTVTLTVTNGAQTSVKQKEIYVTSCTPIQSSQGHWYFSTENGLDFSSGTPVYDNSADINNNGFHEVSAVQSSDTGALLFYTNGVDVFNNAHAQINTGNLLLGDTSSHDGALIVPMPGSTTQFYIFTKDDFSGANGFRYSIVNITGTTASMSTTVNVPIPPPIGCLAGNDGAAIGSEGVAAIASCDGYWIITTNTMAIGTGYFLSVYHLTSTGLTYTQGVTMPIITSHLSIIKASPDGNRLACIAKNREVDGLTTLGGTILYTFNKYTGAVTNPINLQEDFAYGASFSPDSKFFYTGGSIAYQYDLLVANPLDSRKELSNYEGSVGDWQIGPDNKIYIRGLNSKKMSVIHRPNNLISEGGNECQYTADGPIMQQNLSFCLPNNIDARPTTIFTNTISAYPITCLTYSFSSNICGSTYSWTFDDSINNTSTLQNPTHTFSGPGEYDVTVNVSGTIRMLRITVGGTAHVFVGSTTACVANSPQTNHSVSIDSGQTLQWSIVSGTGTMSISTQPDVTINWTSLPGTVRLTTTDASECVNYTDQVITSYCAGDVCAPNIVFSLPETATNQTYKVSNSIITQNNYRLSAGSDISMLAQNFIHIKTDSHIKPGALFLAKIENCVAPRPNVKSNDEIRQKLIAYPNPTDGLLHLEGIKFNEVYLFDLLGKSIFYSKYDSIDTATINMAGLQQGVYFLKVTTINGNTETLKIIKE